MTRAEQRIVQHWRGIAVVCAIVALFGISWALWHRIDASDHRYAVAAGEANKRGDALSAMAEDVRALRAQVKGLGKTPVAPDPGRAVEGLTGRVTVSVPVPGPRGPVGPVGASGGPGGRGVAGSPGVAGSAGPAGPAGPEGAAGAAGPAGRDGQVCPDGYVLRVPSYDPDALVCRRGGATVPGPDPSPSPSPSPGPDPSPSQGPSPVPLAAGLEPQRREYL